MAKILITAGSTVVPIDKVRAITNIFKGKTGTQIAKYFHDEKHDVTLLTSSPEKVEEVIGRSPWINVIPYKTYDQLLEKMEQEITTGNYDIVIHSSAVSDYKVDGVYIEDRQYGMTNINNGGKVSSSYRELYMKLVQTEKIIDKIKREWGFKGFLVKFKLEVGKTDAELLEIARRSRTASDADMIIANCLEWAAERAYAVSFDKVTSVPRNRIGEEIKFGYEHFVRNNW